MMHDQGCERLREVATRPSEPTDLGLGATAGPAAILVLSPGDVDMLKQQLWGCRTPASGVSRPGVVAPRPGFGCPLWACCAARKAPAGSTAPGNQAESTGGADATAPQQPRARRNLAELFQQESGIEAAILPKRRGRPSKKAAGAEAAAADDEFAASGAAAEAAKLLVTLAWGRYSTAFAEFSSRSPGTLQKVPMVLPSATASDSRDTSADPATTSDGSADTAGKQTGARSDQQKGGWPGSHTAAQLLVRRRQLQRQQELRAATAAAAAQGQVLYVPVAPNRSAYKRELNAALKQQSVEQKARAYEERLQQLLEWRDPAPLPRMAGVPMHLPVVDQANWTPLSNVPPTAAAAAADQQPRSSRVPASSAADGASVPSAGTSRSRRKKQPGQALQQPEQLQEQQEGALTVQEAATLAAVQEAMLRVLGVALPERGVRSVRGCLLATLSPLAVMQRLQQWVDVCGRDFVVQVMVKQPTLVAHEPSCLLTTLDALNSRLGIAAGDCVALVARHSVLVGLTGDELELRVTQVADALEITRQQAARLSIQQPMLLMIVPEVLKVRAQAVLELLMLPRQELASVLKLRPEVLVRSPAALARRVQQLAAALNVRVYAAARMVGASPTIVEANPERLGERFVRLMELASSCRAWAAQLQQLSPSSMARCLLCSDTRLERLSELARLGLAGGLELPPFKKILTMPDNYYERMRDSSYARVQRKKALRAAAADADGSGADLVGRSEAAAAAAAAAAADLATAPEAAGQGEYLRLENMQQRSGAQQLASL